MSASMFACVIMFLPSMFACVITQGGSRGDCMNRGSCAPEALLDLDAQLIDACHAATKQLDRSSLPAAPNLESNAAGLCCC